MFRLNRAQALPIGLDIGHDSVKLLQAEVAGDSLAVRAAASWELPPDARGRSDLRIAAAAGILRSLLSDAPFAGRRVVASLPREMVHIKNFRLPQMPLAELEDAVPLEARNLFPFDVEKAVVRFIPAGDVRQNNVTLQEIIVLAVRNELLDPFVEQLHRAGVTLDGLDFAPAALYRCIERFMRRREDEQEVNVLVDIGLRFTQIVIGKGREISFVKTIDIGGLHLQEAVSRKLGIPLDEARLLRRRFAESAPLSSPPREGIRDGVREGIRDASRDASRDPVRQAAGDATRATIEQLAREISLCLRYHSVTFRGQRPNRVRVYGGEAADPQLRTLFNAILSIPVEHGRPLYNLDTARVPDLAPDAAGQWAVALGLAMKGTEQRFAARDGRTRDALAAARLQAIAAAENTPPDALPYAAEPQAIASPALASPALASPTTASVATASVADTPAPTAPVSAASAAPQEVRHA